MRVSLGRAGVGAGLFFCFMPVELSDPAPGLPSGDFRHYFPGGHRLFVSPAKGVPSETTNGVFTYFCGTAFTVCSRFAG